MFLICIWATDTVYLNLYWGFNPLNQVYVFNLKDDSVKSFEKYKDSFNPLNQVYVFNPMMTNTRASEMKKF